MVSAVAAEAEQAFPQVVVSTQELVSAAVAALQVVPEVCRGDCQMTGACSLFLPNPRDTGSVRSGWFTCWFT